MLEANAMYNVYMSNGGGTFVVANSNKQRTRRMEHGSMGRRGCANCEFSKNVGD